MAGLSVAAGLVLYSVVVNRWPPFNGPLYVPLNLVVTGALALLAAGPLGLDSEELGLGGSLFADLMLGVAMGTAVAAPVFATLASRRTARWIADRRVAGLSGAALLYQVLLRVPVGTAVTEEFAFRSVLVGAFLEGGRLEAALISSVAFGLWHVSPTRNLVRANRPDASTIVQGFAVAGAVVLTTIGGLFLTWLRFRAGSIAAPLGLHAALNSLATLAGVAAHRRVAG